MTGNFVVSARLSVGNRDDPSQPPRNTFSLAGIFVHRPIPTRLQAAPVPEPVGAPSWPPSGSAATRQYEVKTTIDSNSQLYYANRGVADSPVIELQLVIVGQTAVVLRRHPGGNWIVENRYTVGGGFRGEIPNFDHDGDPNTDYPYQIGITTYTDWPNMSGQFDPSNTGTVSLASQFHQNYSLITPANGWSANPDLIADVDYVRFARPHPALTEPLLQALPVDFHSFTQSTTTAPLALLPAPEPDSISGTTPTSQPALRPAPGVLPPLAPTTDFPPLPGRPTTTAEDFPTSSNTPSAEIPPIPATTSLYSIPRSPRRSLQASLRIRLSLPISILSSKSRTPSQSGPPSPPSLRAPVPGKTSIPRRKSTPIP